ncbi:CRISPR-associated endonuclease Cas2 [Azospirillum palustre]|uniref:CRISPR-associated endoribonuclease Cas2 n=1 Tax=Azospirillum palustre TaxID=2044885 RepID=A0A2B8BHZ7_9PROT|nr:CRISPR-associated endonuclease Cas2 [Azospirillum palustre]PGH57163.1 CRISPR-associated endonuclease Cas2 [Azospirillum palustre]
MAGNERLYIVTYDIGDPKRGRRVFKAMEGYGRWLQLSVFQCRLTPRRRAALGARLDGLIKPSEDHVLIMDIGPVETVDLRIESLGRPFDTIQREAIVV